MACLVTGAAGFIGSQLAEALISRNREVVGIDCFTDYYPKAIKLSNLARLKQSSRFKFIRADLARADLHKVLRDVDYVFHLAAQPGVRGSWGTTFSHYVDDNILATQRLLEASKDLKIRRFVFASSSSVYGNSEKLPTPETTLPLPVSPYGATKLAAESLCHLYFENFGVPVVTLRYFTVYGPRQRPDMAFHRFIDSISKGSRVEVYGSGKQSRDFTYVNDTVAGTILAMDAKAGSVYNLGSGTSVSLNAATELIESLIGKKALVSRGETAKGDVSATAADTSLITRELGYKPTVRLLDGLKEQIRHQLGT